VILLAANAASAQGTPAGCVRDTHRGPLPGAEVIASGQTRQRRVVTGSAGCFELHGLPAGDYSVKATLAGFVPAVRENVLVVDGRATGAVDFELCLSALDDLMRVVPTFDQMWEMSDVVALVLVESTGPWSPPRAQATRGDPLRGNRAFTRSPTVLAGNDNAAAAIGSGLAALA
jgi:hypothetical protein